MVSEPAPEHPSRHGQRVATGPCMLIGCHYHASCVEVAYEGPEQALDFRTYAYSQVSVSSISEHESEVPCTRSSFPTFRIPQTKASCAVRPNTAQVRRWAKSERDSWFGGAGFGFKVSCSGPVKYGIASRKDSCRCSGKGLGNPRATRKPVNCSL